MSERQLNCNAEENNIYGVYLLNQNLFCCVCSMPYQTITLARSTYDHLSVRGVTESKSCDASRNRQALPLESFGPQLRLWIFVRALGVVVLRGERSARAKKALYFQPHEIGCFCFCLPL